MSERNCRRPARALPPPVSSAGLDRRRVQQRVVARGQQRRSGWSARNRPVRSRARPGRPRPPRLPRSPRWPGRPASCGRSSGLPAQPGSANRRSRRDGCTSERPTAMRASFAGQLPPSPGDQQRPNRQLRGQAQAGAGGFHPAQHAGWRPSPSSRSSGAAAASAAAGPGRIVVGTHYQPSVGRGGAFFHLVARHEPWIRRGSAGTGPLARHLAQDGLLQTRPVGHAPRSRAR